jgi:NDP-sugar pyrophosphorylase family protein
VATYRRTSKIDYGVFELGENGSLTGFREKPEYTFTVSTGVYVFSREILKLVPSERRFGFDDLMFTLLERKERINLFAFDGYWLDVNRSEDYELANADIEKVRSLIT